jgi:ParB-like chromosome segregation protein Spo0J
MKVLIQDIAPKSLKYNTGQIKDVPKNPRFIKDDKFKELVKSLLEDPEMMKIREVVAVDTGKDLVVVGGNMRVRAAIEIGMKDIPVKVLPKDWTAKQIRAFIIKDNLPFGEDDFDLLANKWDKTELDDWGYEFPAEFTPDFEDKENDSELTTKDKVICPSCGLEFTP